MKETTQTPPKRLSLTPEGKALAKEYWAMHMAMTGRVPYGEGPHPVKGK